MALKIGEKAPSFMLYADDATEITSDELLENKLLILFFPLAFSGVCTRQMCLVEDHLSEFKALQTTVIGISVDSLFVLRQFKKENGLTFQLLSDFNKTVSRSFDVLYETFEYQMKGVSKRASFIIDKQGVIRFSEILLNPHQIPSINNIISCLGKIE